MIRRLSAAACLTVVAGLAGAEPGALRAPVHGPVEATLIRVVDGDTLLVEARPWPQHSVTVLVRIRGIDAPELKARCEAARHAANRARARLADLAKGAIRLTDIAGDKYFGRVVADVATERAGDLAASLLAEGLVRTYGGGRRAPPAC